MATKQTEQTEQELSWSEENRRKIDNLVENYPKKSSAIQKVLKMAQSQFGHLNESVQLLVADTLDVPPIQVYEVIQFLDMFQEGPAPDSKIGVCTGLSCMLRGAQDRLNTLCEELDVEPGVRDEETGLLVKEKECIAACDGAPAITLDDTIISDLDEEKVQRLIEWYQSQQEDNEQPDDSEWPPAPEQQKPQKLGDSPTSILVDKIRPEQSHTLETYRNTGGYEVAQEVLQKQDPEEIRETVKEAGVEGRGGAGFPAGVKWGFLPDPDDTEKPIYLVVNADESEPGTFKDRMILEEAPHMLLEGILLTSYAVGSHTSYIYIRSVFNKGLSRLETALSEAYEDGILGEDCLGSGHQLDVHLHHAGGAYICGEETGLINSLEGKKPFPRNKPPFPAIKGLFQCPTLVNNVETLSNIPFILDNGPSWYQSIGSEESPGSRLFCVSGDVEHPGVYEARMNIPAEELIYDVAGGIRNGNDFKGVIPGGSSTAVLTEEELDTGMDFTSLREIGSNSGSGGVMVLDDTRCMVRVLINLAHFYHVESCGQCTPCREGTGWAEKVLRAVENGNANQRDLDLLTNIGDRMQGKTICALADGAVMPIQSFVEKYRDEFEAHIEEEGCPFDGTFPGE